MSASLCTKLTLQERSSLTKKINDSQSANVRVVYHQPSTPSWFAKLAAKTGLYTPSTTATILLTNNANQQELDAYINQLEAEVKYVQTITQASASIVGACHTPTNQDYPLESELRAQFRMAQQTAKQTNSRLEFKLHSQTLRYRPRMFLAKDVYTQTAFDINISGRPEGVISVHESLIDTIKRFPFPKYTASIDFES